MVIGSVRGTMNHKNLETWQGWLKNDKNFGQTVEEYVRQRHEQLKNRNHKNDDIWPLILDELRYRRFKADELTPRQLRRIVYG